MAEENSMEKIVSLAKRRGFIYPGSEIYGGLAGTWDYGPLGVELKQNIKNLWWERFVSRRDDIYGVDASILMHPQVWEASGHLANFIDPMVACKKCNERFRADQIENKCPECSGELGEVKQFNMMLETRVGATSDIVESFDRESPKGRFEFDPYDTKTKIYLRPETAQGIFTNFKNIVDSFHPKIPFGIAQTGKAFRNEISPRDFIFRSREFEQMEIEYFVKEENWKGSFKEWREEVRGFMKEIGLDSKKIHEREVDEEELAHYSKKTIDFDYDFPFGTEELYGLAYRTDFDLKNHFPNMVWTEDDHYRKRVSKESHMFIPHVIEPTFGVDRTVLALLADAYREDPPDGEAGNKRVWLKLSPKIAPYKAAVFPLLRNKPELVKKAREIYDSVKTEIPNTLWDDNGNVGKRYRRQDEIGTPFCVTVDFDTLEGGRVTVRDRDTMEQEPVPSKGLVKHLNTKLNG